jgi:hypothetical protein
VANNRFFADSIGRAGASTIKDGRDEALHGSGARIRFDLVGPNPGGTHPPIPAARIKRAYKLRQQPAEAPGEWTARGSFMWRSMSYQTFS